MTFPWERAVVISVAERPERLARFREQAGRVDLQAAALTPRLDSANGRRGCMRAHALALATAIGQSKPTAVFEDDAMFCEGFIHRLHRLMRFVPDSWDVLWLGGKHHGTPRRIAPGVVAPVRVMRSHAYMVRDGLVAEQLLDSVRSHLDVAENCRMNVVHYDYLLSTTVSDLALEGYAPDPWLVGQAAGRSDVSGQINKERWF